MQNALRVRHLSLRTEKAYLHWIRRYILFHGKRHPAEMGEQEVNAQGSVKVIVTGVSTRPTTLTP